MQDLSQKIPLFSKTYIGRGTVLVQLNSTTKGQIKMAFPTQKISKSKAFLSFQKMILLKECFLLSLISMQMWNSYFYDVHCNNSPPMGDQSTVCH